MLLLGTGGKCVITCHVAICGEVIICESLGG
jgi:hypothetical protein